MAERFDRIWLNARLATVRGNLPGLGVIEDGLIAARDGASPSQAAVPTFHLMPMRPSGSTVRGGGSRPDWWIVIPISYSAETAPTNSVRLQGASYEEIARAGGGIVSTVAATRASSEANLLPGRCRGSTR